MRNYTRINTNITKDQHQTLKMIAYQDDTSISTIVREAVEQFLKKIGRKKG